MYPGKMNPEQAYHIDNMLELASEQLAKLGWALNPDTRESGWQQYKTTELPKFLQAIEDRLCDNVDPRFLVGYGLTAADCSIGSFALRTAYNDQNPNMKEYSEIWMKYPKTWNWATGTIFTIFGNWFKM